MNKVPTSFRIPIERRINDMWSRVIRGGFGCVAPLRENDDDNDSFFFFQDREVVRTFDGAVVMLVLFFSVKSETIVVWKSQRPFAQNPLVLKSQYLKLKTPCVAHAPLSPEKNQKRRSSDNDKTTYVRACRYLLEEPEVLDWR